MNEPHDPAAPAPDGPPAEPSGDRATRVIVAQLLLPDGSTAAVREGQRLVVGSAEGCDVRLDAEGVAPRHCAIDATGEDLLAEALSGEHPLLLNGKPVGRVLVGHGDALGLGGARIEVTTTAGALRQARRARLRRLVRWGLPTAVGLAAILVAAALAWPHLPRKEDGGGVAPPVVCRAVFTSEPDRAWVWIDGTFRGETPLTVELPAAQPHPVRVTKDGYRDWEGSVPSGKAEAHVHAPLSERPRGTVVVAAYPRGAVVFVGGKQVGTAPVEAPVPSGEQSVRVECEGYEPFEITAAVPEGEAVEVRCILRYESPERLRQQARSEPRDARAWAQLAEALLTRGETGEAVDCLRLALGLVASKRDASHWETAAAEALPRLYREPPVPGLAPDALPRLQQQLDAVLQAVNAEYAHPALLGAFVRILDDAGKLALAERLCEDAMAKAPTAAAPYVALAGLYARRERFTDATAVLTLGEAARRPDSDACFAVAIAWAKLAPHVNDAAARAKAELARALDACTTLDERRRLGEDFQQATGIQAIEP